MTATERPIPAGVRRAERADLLDVLRIERASFPQPWPYDAFGEFLGEPGFLVADEGIAPDTGPGAGAPLGREGPPVVVGYVVADTVDRGGRSLGHVKDLAVRADRRGEGLGSRLLERGLAAVERAGATAVKLEVRPSNGAAQSLYRQYGFERRSTVPGYYADGEDAEIFVRDC